MKFFLDPPENSNHKNPKISCWALGNPKHKKFENNFFGQRGSPNHNKF